MKKLARALLLVLFAVWVAVWFWFFSFQYSPGFFQYHLDTRLPFLALSLLAVVVAPLSGYFFISRTVRGVLNASRAALFHALVSAAPLGLFWCVSAAWVAVARHGGRLAFEADEAMGRGIDFMVCVGVVLLSYFVVGAVLLVSAFVRGRKRMRRPRLASGKES
jgi:hypothetical protein